MHGPRPLDVLVRLQNISGLVRVLFLDAFAIFQESRQTNRYGYLLRVSKRRGLSLPATLTV
jgi:hypothetical protein